MWRQSTLILSSLVPRIRSAVPSWGRTIQILSNLSPKRGCTPKRIVRGKSFICWAIGGRIQSITQPRDSDTLPPLWGVGTVYGRTLTYPLRVNETNEMCVCVCFRDARASVFVRGTLEVRFEPVSSTTSNVKVLPAELLLRQKTNRSPNPGKSFIDRAHSYRRAFFPNFSKVWK